MEGGGAAVSSEKKNATLMESSAAGASSYTYWVREMTQDAAPLPVPRKLNHEDLSNQSQPQNHLGSLWNRELLVSVGTLQFSVGKAEIKEIS